MNNKNVEIRELGYYHPSNANWSYHIYLVEWNGFTLKVKSTFGGESRLKDKLIELGFTVDFSPIGQFEMKYSEIKNLLDTDNDIKDILEKITVQHTYSN